MRSKIRRPIDLEWSRGLAVVTHLFLLKDVQETMLFNKNGNWSRCPDRQVAQVLFEFVFFCGGVHY